MKEKQLLAEPLLGQELIGANRRKRARRKYARKRLTEIGPGRDRAGDRPTERARCRASRENWFGEADDAAEFFNPELTQPSEKLLTGGATGNGVEELSRAGKTGRNGRTERIEKSQGLDPVDPGAPSLDDFVARLWHGFSGRREPGSGRSGLSALFLHAVEHPFDGLVERGGFSFVGDEARFDLLHFEVSLLCDHLGVFDLFADRSR